MTVVTYALASIALGAVAGWTGYRIGYALGRRRLGRVLRGVGSSLANRV